MRFIAGTCTPHTWIRFADMDWLRDSSHRKTSHASAFDGTGSIAAVATLTFILGYFAYVIYGRAQLQTSRQVFKLKHGCQPSSSVYPGLDPFGIIWTYIILSRAVKHQLLPWLHTTHNQLGRTVLVEDYANTGVLTNDAEKSVRLKRKTLWLLQSLSLIQLQHQVCSQRKV